MPGPTVGRDYDYEFTFMLEDGTEYSSMGGVCKYSLWRGNWTALDKLAARVGGRLLKQYIEDVKGDWVFFHVCPPESLVIEYDPYVEFVLGYEDGHEVRSLEIVLTDTPLEHKVWSSGLGLIRLERDQGPYWKPIFRRECFVLFVRFPYESLALDHDRSLERAPFPLPDTFMVERRRIE